MRGAPAPHVGGPDRLGERAPRVLIGDEDPLVGVRNRRRLGHEMHPADDEQRRVPLGRAPRHPERISSDVRHVLDLGPLVVVRQDGRLAVSLERPDLGDELRAHSLVSEPWIPLKDIRRSHWSRYRRWGAVWETPRSTGGDGPLPAGGGGGDRPSANPIVNRERPEREERSGSLFRGRVPLGVLVALPEQPEGEQDEADDERDLDRQDEEGNEEERPQLPKSEADEADGGELQDRFGHGRLSG